MTEVETEVYLSISFNKWTDKEKLFLIEKITQGSTYEFTGKTVFEISPRRTLRQIGGE